MTLRNDKPDLLTIEDADNLTADEALALFSAHYNPGLAKMMSMLGFSKFRPVRAEGTRIYMDDGNSVLDFTGGVGVLNHGHNHPRILKVREEIAKKRQIEVWKFFPSPYQSTLCRNLAQVFPEDLDVVFLCNSGAEANEGALKMAEKAAGPKRRKIAFTDISFHGKSHATLTLSGSEGRERNHFNQIPGCIQVPHSDAETFEKALKDNRNQDGSSQIGCFIVEAIRSEGVITPPEGYFTRIRKLCDKYKVTLICDEVYTGFGRTGKMFAFEHYGFVPDIVTFSKSFGGGKATLAGYVARKPLYDKAYGSMAGATLHSTTFSGFTEEVITAIEAIHILYDEGLVENARVQGEYLLERLREVKARHPGIVADVTGVGLLACVRLESLSARVLEKIPGAKLPSAVISKLTTGGILTEMIEKHKILTFTPPHDYNVLLLTPPLIITREEIDAFIEALDDVLKTNLVETVVKFTKRFLTN